MTVHLKPETEAFLRALAREQGLSIEAMIEKVFDGRDARLGFLRQIISGHFSPIEGSESVTSQLPVWHLGATIRLRRRDIYDDVR